MSYIIYCCVNNDRFLQNKVFKEYGMHEAEMKRKMSMMYENCDHSRFTQAVTLK